MPSPYATRQQQRVAIEPISAAFGFRQMEAIRQELLGHGVELAQYDRIAAAARQAQDRAVMGAGQGRCAAPDPILVLSARQRVEVKDDLPLRLNGSEAAERGSPPEPARVGGILPIIVEVWTAPGDVRDVVWPIVDCGERIAIRREARMPEARERGLVLRVDPGQRTLALDLLKPEMRIVLRSSERRPGVDGHDRNITAKNEETDEADVTPLPAFDCSCRGS